MLRSSTAAALLTALAALVGAEPPPRAARLEPASAFASTLAPGEVHRYEAPLRQGDFLHLEVAQEGIDVTVTVDGPAGRRLAEIDNPYGRTVPESVAVVAASEGVHSLDVRPFRSATAAGRSRLEVVAWRPATPADRLRADAEAAVNAAHASAASGDAEGLRAARAGYGAARALWRRLGDRLEEARTVARLGQVQRRLGAHDAALATLEEALALARALDDDAGVASALNEIATVHKRRGENDRAIEVYRQALAAWQALGDVAREARVHNNLATALEVAGELDRARLHYRKALEIARALGDRRREAIALVNLGHLHGRRGRLDLAVEKYEQGAEIAAADSRHDLEADARNLLGNALGQLGELHAALDSHGAALEVYRRLGERRRQAAALTSQGALLHELGRPGEARQRLLEAAELLREHGDPYLEGNVQLGLGAVARALGDRAGALELFARARELQRAAGDREGEAYALFHQASIRLEASAPAAAGELARRSLAIFRDIGNALGEARALRALGESEAARGRADAARATLEQAASRAAALGALTEQARGYQALGRLAREGGDLEAASGHLERALGLLESLRAEIAGEPLRTSHFATVREVYELAVDVAMLRHRARPEAGFDRHAFALSEMARARGLLDVLARARVEPAAGDPGLRAREQRLRRELNALALGRRQGTSDDASEDRIAALMAEYRLLQARLSPPAGEVGFGAEVRGAAFSPHMLDEAAALLGDDTALLEIALGEPRSYLWVLARRSLTSFELPGRATIEAVAERLHRHLGRSAADRTARRTALDELGRMVLAPAAAYLDLPRWAVVADGALHYVPFAALPVPGASGGADGAGEPLMVDREVVHLPSLAVLARLRGSERRPTEDKLAVLADPIYGDDDPRLHENDDEQTDRRSGPEREPLARLPWTGREAAAIVAAAGDEGDGTDAGVLLALGADASRDLATAGPLGGYRVVHFATHGVLDTRHPELSGLALARYDAAGRRREGFLRLHDIYPLRWHTELVVLSGCRTALGRTMRGEGLIGLARGFLHAGATQVVASLWSVRDQASAELMARFYRGLFHDGLAPAAALRAAQRSMRSERRWRDPHFWAPFVLIGDWRWASGPGS